MTIIPKDKYKKATDPGFKTKAWVHCPRCDRRSALDHDIGADGKVSPSLVCPYDDCDFHDYVTLEGWGD